MRSDASSTPTTATTSSASGSCCCASTATHAPTRWSSGRWRSASCRVSLSTASDSNASPARRSASRTSHRRSPTSFSCEMTSSVVSSAIRSPFASLLQYHCRLTDSSNQSSAVLSTLSLTLINRVCHQRLSCHSERYLHQHLLVQNHSQVSASIFLLIHREFVLLRVPLCHYG